MKCSYAENKAKMPSDWETALAATGAILDGVHPPDMRVEQSKAIYDLARDINSEQREKLRVFGIGEITETISQSVLDPEVRQNLIERSASAIVGALTDTEYLIDERIFPAFDGLDLRVGHMNRSIMNYKGFGPLVVEAYFSHSPIKIVFLEALMTASYIQHTAAQEAWKLPAKRLELAENEREISAKIGLLHSIGRTIRDNATNGATLMFAQTIAQRAALNGDTPKREYLVLPHDDELVSLASELDGPSQRAAKLHIKELLIPESLIVLDKNGTPHFTDELPSKKDYLPEPSPLSYHMDRIGCPALFVKIYDGTEISGNNMVQQVLRLYPEIAAAVRQRLSEKAS